MMVLCNSPEEIKVVSTSAPATSNWDVGMKPEPITMSVNAVLVTVWVTDPDSKTGSKFRSLTLNEAEDAPGVLVVAPMVTEWPAMIVDTGVYMPEVDMGPVEAVPPTTPLTDHTAGVGTPATRALYCAFTPNLIRSGPLIDSCAEAWV